MAYTQEQLDALRAALASGLRRVRFENREVEYRSIDEIKAAIAAAEAELSEKPVMRQIRVVTSKGF
jgi:hypothetical protein